MQSYPTAGWQTRAAPAGGSRSVLRQLVRAFAWTNRRQVDCSFINEAVRVQKANIRPLAQPVEAAGCTAASAMHLPRHLTTMAVTHNSPPRRPCRLLPGSPIVPAALTAPPRSPLCAFGTHAATPLHATALSLPSTSGRHAVACAAADGRRQGVHRSFDGEDTDDIDDGGLARELARRADPQRMQRAAANMDLVWQIRSSRSKPCKCGGCAGSGELECGFCHGTGKPPFHGPFSQANSPSLVLTVVAAAPAAFFLALAHQIGAEVRLMPRKQSMSLKAGAKANARYVRVHSDILYVFLVACREYFFVEDAVCPRIVHCRL